MPFVPYWQERHPGHDATIKLAERAVFLVGLEKVNTPQEVYRRNVRVLCPMRHEAPVSFLVGISEARYPRIDLYRSQVNPGTPGRTIRLSSSLSSHAAIARDVDLGSLIGRPAYYP